MSSSIQCNTQMKHNQTLKVKVQRALQNIRQLNNQISLQQKHKNYLTAFQSKIQSHIEEIRRHFQKNKENTNLTLKKLGIQAIFKKQKNTQWINPNNKCKPSQHLKQIFQQNRKNQTIEQLQNKLNGLYQTIEKKLQKQQPYIHEKLMQRIKKQTKRQGKIKILNQLNAQIKKNNDWLKGNKKKIEIESLQKQIQNKTINNLEKMKQLMNQKVNINDYMYSMIENDEQQNYHIKQFERLSKILKNSLEETEKNFAQKKNGLSYDILQNSSSINAQKHVTLNLNQISGALNQGRSFLKKSIDQNTQNRLIRIQKVEFLVQRLNKVI